MKKSKKIISLVLVLVFAFSLISLTGCSYNASGSDSSATTKKNIEPAKFELKYVQASTPADGKYNIRFISILDNYDYSLVGYDATVVYKDSYGNIGYYEIHENSDNIYTQLTVDGVLVKAEDYGGTYFFILTLNDIETYEQIDFYIIPYKLSGTVKTYGEEKTVTYKSGILTDDAEPLEHDSRLLLPKMLSKQAFDKLYATIQTNSDGSDAHILFLAKIGSGYYDKKDPANAQSEMLREEMLNIYPITQEKVIYVLGDDLTTEEKKNISKMIKILAPDTTFADIYEMHEEVGYYDWLISQK